MKKRKFHHKPNVWRKLWLGLELIAGIALALTLLKHIRLAPKHDQTPPVHPG